MLLDSRIEARRTAVAPKMEVSAFFDLFAAEQVLKNFQPNIEALMYGLVDGEKDCGIDGFYCYINDQLLRPGITVDNLGRNPRIDCIIIQCKTTPGFSESVIEKLNFHLPKLLDFQRDEQELASYAHDRLLNLTRTLLEHCLELAPVNPKITFYVYYASRGDEPTPQMITKSREITATLRKRLFPGSMAHFNFLGARHLLEYAQQSAQINLSLPFREGPLSSESDQGQGYVCLVDLEAFYEFITNDDGTLNGQIFEANVRDHEATSEVNRSIQLTLGGSDPEDFWWLNNGVTIVAPTVQQMGKRLHLVDPQIVNGLQTSNEIYRHFTMRGKRAGNTRNVLVRVIVPQEERSRDRIIRATNSQTQLPGSALRATDKFQYKIEEYFLAHGFFYDRRKNYYLNQGRALDRIVSIETLAQAVACCYLREPWMARSRTARLLDDQLYDRLFSEKFPINMYLNALLLLRRVKSALQEHPIVSKGDIDDWLFHVTTVASMLVTSRSRPGPKDLANLRVVELPRDRIGDLVPVVAFEFNKFGKRGSYTPFSVMASDEGVSTSLVHRVESMLLSNRWRKWPEEAMVDQEFKLDSDVMYRSGGRRR